MRKFSSRQEQIVKTSINLIANQGIQQLTIKHISQEIGFSEPAIYRHFQNKLDIMLAILDYFEEITLSFRQEMMKPGLTGIERIEIFLLNRYQLFTKDHALAKIMFSDESFQYETQLSLKFLDIMNNHRNLLVLAIRQAQLEGSIPSDIPYSHLFQIIVGSMRLLVNRWSYSNFSFDLKSEGMSLWQTIKKIIQRE